MRHMLSHVRVLAALVLVVASGLATPAPAAVDQQPERPPVSADPDTESLARQLHEQPWRIHSFLFQVMPPQGHPIAFLADGRFESRHWRLSAFWEVTPEGELLLWDRTRREVVRFAYDAELKVWVAYQEGRADFPYAIIGREGTDLGRAFETLTRRKK